MVNTRYQWNTNCRVVELTGESAFLFNNESGWQAKIKGPSLNYSRDLWKSKDFGDEDLLDYPRNFIDLLKKNRIIIPEAGAQDYYTSVNKHISNHLNNKWKLIVLPTEKCNFACYYCYEKRERPKMKRGIVEAAEALITRWAMAAPAFQLSFFGGEPLLAKELVLKFLKVGYENSPNKESFTGDITTNASLLTQDLIEQFTSHQLLHYQITLDGPEHIHDAQRVSNMSQPTFMKVLNSLELLHNSQDMRIQVNVRMNVHAHAAEDYLPILENPTFERLLKDPRFNLKIHEIWGSDLYKASGEDSTADSKSKLEKVSRFMGDTVNSWKGIKNNQFLKSPCEDACYAGKPNQFVLYPDGTIGKCTVILEESRNQIGRLELDGSLVIDPEKHNYWIAKNALSDKHCQTCAYRVTCAGIGCPINRIKPGDGTCSLRNMYDQMWRSVV